MESLSETEWDAVISGTGLQQSLLALALSRSGKNILHVDRNNYYGEHEAALSLQEADGWAEKHQSLDGAGVFAGAEVKKEDGISSSRAYSLALAPQLIHSRSELLDKLVSSKAFRQLEFQAVGSFYIYQPASDGSEATLARIPSTREDVFRSTAIGVRAQRLLMKFLKFVLDYQSEEQTAVWSPHKDTPLADFLVSQFKLDAALQSYVVTLTLSPDGKISVADGLFVIHRHLTSMGVFGPGFAAVYPKWGGLSEIAQVGCRAGAVGGAIYMLGTGIKQVHNSDAQAEKTAPLTVDLVNDVTVKAKIIIQETDTLAEDATRTSRLIAVVDSPVTSLFETVVEGAPTPCASIVAFPAGSVSSDGTVSTYPIYAVLHSSDSGECPNGQCVVYLSTPHSSESKSLLEQALALLLKAAEPEKSHRMLYQLSFQQYGGKQATLSISDDQKVATFGRLPVGFAFDDKVLSPVREAWELVTAPRSPDDGEYMVFDDREGANDEDDVFDS